LANYFVLDKKKVTRGVLSNTIPDGCPYYKDYYEEDVVTGWLTHQFEVPADRPEANFIELEGYIIFPDFQGRQRMVKIVDIDDQADDGTRKWAYAEGAHTELGDKRVRPFTMENATPEQGLGQVLIGTGWEVGTIESGETAPLEMKDYPTTLEGIQTIRETFGLYPVFRVEYSELTGRIHKVVDLVQQRGKRRGKLFDFHKDMLEITRKQHSRELYTGVIPLGKSDDNDQRLTVSSVSWATANGDPADKPPGDDVIVDPVATQEWRNDGDPKIGKYENSNQTDPELLAIEGWEWLQEHNKPSYQYAGKAVDVKRLTGAEHEEFDAGDVVAVRNLDFNPPMLVEAEILKTKRSHSDPTADEFEFGNYKDIYKAEKDKLDALEALINRKSGTWEAKGPTWYEGPDAPDPTEYTTWLKTGVVPNVWMKWDGSTWNRATATQPGDVGTIGESDINERDTQTEANAENFTRDWAPKVYSQDTPPSAPIPAGSHWLNTIEKRWYKWNGTSWELKTLVDFSEFEGQIKNAQIGIGAVAENQLAELAVTMDKLADDSVANSKILDRALSNAKIQLDAIDNSLMAIDSINTEQIVNDTITNALMAPNAVGTLEIVDRALSTAKIQLDAIDNTLMAVDSVNTSEIVNRALTGGKIALDAVTNNLVADGAIQGENVVDRAMSGLKIALDAITNDLVAVGAIGSTELGSGSVISGKLGTSAVGSGNISSGAVISGKLGSGAVGTSNVVDRAMSGLKIALDAIDNTLMADGSIQSEQLVNGSVVSGKIGSGAVGTSEIVDRALSNAKIQLDAIDQTLMANGSVGTSQIIADSITNGELANLSVNVEQVVGRAITGAKIALTTVDNENVITRTLTADRIVSLALTANEIAGSTITGSKISGSTITGSNIAGTTITGSKIVGNTITATQIASRTITASQLVANTITANEIMANTITASQIFAGTLTANEIAGTTITANRLVAGTLTSNEIASRSIVAGDIVADSLTAGEIATNAVTATEIASSTITASQISSRTITAGLIAVGAITANEIASRTIVAGDIVSGTLTANEIAGTTITGDRIVANTLTATQINANAITASELATNSVSATHIVSRTITADKIVANAISANEIMAGTITGNEIKTSTLTADHISVGSGVTEDGNIASGKTITLSSGSTSTILTDGTKTVGASYQSFGAGNSTGSNSESGGDYIQIDLGKVYRIAESRAFFYSGDSRFYWYKIKYSKDGVNWLYAVGNSNNDGWVTSSKANAGAKSYNPTVDRFNIPITARYVRLYANGNSTNSGNHLYEWELYTTNQTVIHGSDIWTGSVTASEIAGRTITADRLVSNTITANEIATNSITSTEINARTIVAGNLVASTLTSYEIASNTIRANEIASYTITSNQIASESIYATRIVARTLTSTRIASGTITANELSARSITADKLVAGTITANEISANSITTNHIASAGLTADVIKGGTISGVTISGVNILGDNTVIKNAIEVEGSSSTGTINMYPGWAGYYKGGTRSARFGIGSITTGVGEDQTVRLYPWYEKRSTDQGNFVTYGGFDVFNWRTSNYSLQARDGYTFVNRLKGIDNAGAFDIGNYSAGIEVDSGASRYKHDSSNYLYIKDNVTYFIHNAQWETFFQYHEEDYGHVSLRMGNGRIKGLNSGSGTVQIRTWDDADYGLLVASNVSASSMKEYKNNIEELAVDAMAKIKGTKAYKYNRKWDKKGSKKHVGLVYEEAPEEIQDGEGGVSLYGMASMLWKANQQMITIIEDLTKRIEKMEGKK
jgi:phage minor structural protein